MANPVSTDRGTVGMSVAIYGLRDAQHAMRQFAPDLKKEMDKQIRAALQPVRSRAQARVPGTVMSGWQNWQGERLAWDPRKIKSGIRIAQGGRGRRTSGVKVAWRLTNVSAIGSIIEVAGRKNPGGNSDKGRQFIANLNRFAQPSRLIWAAWDDLGGDEQVTPKVVEAIEAATAEFDRRMAAASDETL